MVIESLCQDYMESKQGIDIDEWPPNQPRTVVNVALIHYKGSRTEQELIEISKRHKEGTTAVDELAHHSRVTKDITKLFQTDNTCLAEAKTKLPKFILIEGAPGIGKTVLAKKIAYLWAKKELLNDVKVLFLMFLRDPELQTITTPEQLIKYLSSIPLDEKQLESCMKEIMESKVAIVMDGFDEYPNKLRKRSFIADIINHKVFRNCIVVLTSRPTATIFLHGKVNRRIEILGFAQEERDQYISESLDSPEQTKQLQDYLRYQPIINGLVYVPLHLAILLYLFKFQNKLPETLTEMNELFILHTIYRSLTKNQLTADDTVTAIDAIKDLPNNILDIVNRLSKLAFKGLQSNQLVFSYIEIKAIWPEIETDIPGAYNGFGLLQAVQHFSKKGAGTTASFNFLHFTMQEFLAARHVSDSIPHEQQLQLMNKTFWDSMYSFMWMMYVGINGINSQTFVQFLYMGQITVESTLSNHITSDKLKCLYLFQCFMEAKCKEVPKGISSIFYNDEIDFHGLQLLPHHISSLMLYISKYSVPLQSLTLRDCHIGDTGMSILEHFFIANPDKASNIKCLDLFGNNSVLLWNVYCAIFGKQNLKKLNWSSLKGVTAEEIVFVMDNNKTVQSLNLSDNHFNNDDAERIAKVLKNNTTLQELDFSNNSIRIKGANSISESIQYNSTLQRLKISWKSHFINTDHSTISLSQSHIKDGDVRIVANILCSNKTVTKLDLSLNQISDNGAVDLSKCIKNNQSLIEINLSGNKISYIGLKKLALGLRHNQILQKLDISHNNVSNEEALAICKCLKASNTLKELIISNTGICNKGIVNICAALQMNTTLKILNLSHNNLSDIGTVISDCLRKNNSLQELNLSYNVMFNDETISIAEALQVNTTLKILDISHTKNITSDGVCAFSDHLKKRNNIQLLRISWNDSSYLAFNSMDQSCDTCRMNLGDAGAILISALLYGKLLYGNINMHKLNVSYNNISDIGIEAISKCLNINITLQELNISHNCICDNGARAISEHLKKNSTLQDLNLSANEITDEGMMIILKNFNGKLRTLNFTHNIISESGIPAIHKIYKNLESPPTIQISYNQIIDNAQNVITVLKNFDGQDNKEYERLVNYCEMKCDIQDRSPSYKAKVLCFSAKDNNSVKVLDISNCDISSEGAKVIAKAIQGNTSLEELNISHNNISDAGAIAIGKTLRNHNYKNNSSYMVAINETVTTDRIQYCTLLKLDMSYNNISSEGIIAFADCLKYNSSLQELTISWNNFETSLVLNGTNQFYNMSCKHLKKVGSILLSAFLFYNNRTKVLDISNNNIPNDGAAPISECLRSNNMLQKLNMSRNILSDEGIVNISKSLQINTTLQVLNISDNTISNHGAVAISKCLINNNTLQKIDMSDNIKVSDEGIIKIADALRVNRTLKWLNISNNNITDHGAAAISKCLINNETLQGLNMSQNEVSDKGIINIGKAIQNNASLKKFDISNNKLSDNGVLIFSGYLKRKSMLRCLRMSWDNRYFDVNFNVTSLNMSNKYYSVTEAILLSAILHHNMFIQVLNISRNDISDDGAVAISESLKNNGTLQKLNMSHNKISDRGIINIFKALQNNRTLQLLDISHNKISDDGAVDISECLKSNNTLQQFKMSHNLISDIGIISITKALLINRTLQVLDISNDITNISDNGLLGFRNYLKAVLHLKILWNDKHLIVNLQDTSNRKMYINCNHYRTTRAITFLHNCVSTVTLDLTNYQLSDNAAVAISEYLKSDNTLRELNMSYNRLSDKGIVSIAEALKINSTLQLLNISHNIISNDGAVAISEYLMNNNTLQELNLSYNRVSDKGIVSIAKALQINRTLELLDISSDLSNITNKGLLDFSSYLKGKCTLQHLRISWNDKHLDLNLKVISHHKIYIMCNYYGTTGAILLSTFLHHYVCTVTLDLTNYQLSDNAAVAISEYLKSNNTLQELNMSHNRLSDKGIVSIVRALKINRTLRLLNISHNTISDDGAVAISECLMNNNTLQQLNMSCNRVSDKGIVSIAEALQINRTLELLDISSDLSNITNKGLLDFSSYLKGKCTLQHLRISWNDKHLDLNLKAYHIIKYILCATIMEPLELLLSTFLHHYVCTVTLDLTNYQLSDNAAVAISEYLKSNNTLKN